ncbi:DUF2079 domain-containing protein [Candidatus Saganbacteria bacterium]|nr:DUF2079 domain-containing protein [Candidatus Saganbacteria bacterium]
MEKEGPTVKSTLDNYKRFFSCAGNLFKNIDLNDVPFYLLLFSIAYYIAAFSLFSIFTHENFSFGAHDAGVYDQGIWLLSRFMSPYCTLGGTLLFGIHVSGYCIFLAPLFWLWPSIHILYVAQTVLLAVSAIPLFKYAKTKLKNPFLALVVGLSFLLYPALQNMNLENFHPEVLVVFFLTLAIYFMLTENFKYFFIFAVLSMFGKEEMGLVVAFMGLYLLLFKKGRAKEGFIALGAGIAWFLLCFRVIMPLSNHVGLFSTSKPLVYSHWFGGYANNLFNFSYYWSSFFNPQIAGYLGNLFGPILYIPLFSSQILIMALPEFALNVLSNSGYFTSINYHYNYVITVVFFFALIESLSLITAFKFKSAKTRAWAMIFIGAMFFLNSYIQSNKLSGFPVNKHFAIIADRLNGSRSVGALDRFDGLKLIPKDSPVSASYSLFSHLSHRKEIYIFPNPFMEAFWDKDPRPNVEHADYIALALGNHSEEEKQVIGFLAKSNYYKQIYNEGDVIILKRDRGYKKSSYLGANYILNSKTKGIIPTLFFPDSGLELKDLLGELIPTYNGISLEIFGYLFIPETNEYQINLSSDAPSQIEIDNKFIRNTAHLSQGFHKYAIKYMNNGTRRYNLKLLLIPKNGSPYIISDKDLFLENDPVRFGKHIQEYNELKREAKEFSAQQPNLIKNGDFEDIIGNQAKDWQTEGWQDEKTIRLFEADRSTNVSGKYSLKITHKGLADSRLFQGINVKPSAYYKLSGWIKTKSIQNKGAGAYLMLEGTSLRTQPITGDNDWKYVETTGKTSRNQKILSIICRIGDYGAPNEGTAYFDDVAFRELPKE